MKFLKVLLIIIGILVAAFLIAALIIPKDYAVERTVEIEAPYDVVFKLTSGLEGMHAWSPWAKKDTAMEIRFEGNEGEVGQKYFWKGNEDVGEGHQEIISISEELIETKLVFLTPMEGEGMANVKIEKGEYSVSVTWGYYGTTPFPMNVMNLMMDGMMGGDFEKGLADLKEMCENMPEEAPKPAFNIVEVEMEAKNFVAFRQLIPQAELQIFFATHFTAVAAFATEKQLVPASSPSAIYYLWDEENKQADLAAGMALSGELTDLPEGYQIISVSGKALVIDYYGEYEGIGLAHLAMDEYMRANGLELNEIVMEEYVTDPSTVEEPSQILTKLYYFVN